MSARMYIGVKFGTKKEIKKCVLVLLGLNVEQKARFCNNTGKAYKVKCLNVELIIVLLFLFCPVIIKLCACFLLDVASRTSQQRFSLNPYEQLTNLNGMVRISLRATITIN